MNYFLVFLAFFILNYDLNDPLLDALTKAGACTFLFVFILKELSVWLVILVKALHKH